MPNQATGPIGLQATNVMTCEERHPLIGTWSHDFKPEDTIKIVIATKVSGFDVKVINKETGEQANVYDIAWDGENLKYNIYWKSNGRYLRCTIRLNQPGHLAYTYSHITTEMWSRESDG